MMGDEHSPQQGHESHTDALEYRLSAARKLPDVKCAFPCSFRAAAFSASTAMVMVVAVAAVVKLAGLQDRDSERKMVGTM